MKIVFFFLIFITLSCTHFDQFEETSVDASPMYLTGRSMTQNLCLSCHAVEGTAQAPSFEEIMSVYNEAFPIESDRHHHLKKFLRAPSKELSAHRPWIEQYGLMPNMSYTPNQIDHLTFYLVNSDLQDLVLELTPEEQALVVTLPEEQALEIVLDSRSALGGTLMRTIRERGVDEAVSFCHVEAIPITTRKATEHEVELKRVSDRPRNPKNRVSSEEQDYIEKFNQRLNDGEDLGFVIVERGERITFYSPILTNQICLQCHGDPEENIRPTTLSIIDELYPEDKARGYEDAQLRGMWKVEWSR